MANSALPDLFGPMNRDYCMYFYLIAAFSLFFGVIRVISTLYYGFSKGKGFTFYVKALSNTLVFFIVYLQNRLLFNMCANTV